jgi:hypothetical protein
MVSTQVYGMERKLSSDWGPTTLLREERSENDRWNEE